MNPLDVELQHVVVNGATGKCRFICCRERAESLVLVWERPLVSDFYLLTTCMIWLYSVS